MAANTNPVVAMGVAQTTTGALMQPRYHTSEILADGTIRVNEKESFPSWQAATAESKSRADKASVPYLIADQVKAFQRRLAKSAEGETPEA